jgi:aryl-alcohol dehydrogenase-like predicted oxidoreductase
VPVEEVAAAMNKLKSEGLIRFVGLSECTPVELRLFHAICPVSCIQMEYSIGCREIEEDLLPCARALGVSVVAYAPLARGLLAGMNPKDLHPHDWRQCVRFP